ncbi:TolC family outer membrane protein [Methylobacterium gregans]|uniref:Outer membrane efflux protein BepC n=1 Tax=Methylobacterium gregans TaxID=374424 RepID=A0AA37HL80_9HYPH|nr:TolC family outer membrane protein [Methylobacterium gregans]MDQ0520258.1 outer membrane protein [Methylobacterium gregans]GJD77648.1 Outer membrane efflux protein BepC [Methylobacterium gregans]GLS52662.1 channel protein TolC [Methylobacterium gregans]
MRRRTPETRAAFRLAGLAVTAGLSVGAVGIGSASAESLESALARAYAGNPQLNASRALTRVRDEDVAIAQSGYRPSVNINVQAGVTQTEGNNLSAQSLTGGGGQSIGILTKPATAGITINQNLFNGFQTDNNTRRAESGVYSQRETLRFTELSTLYSAVQAYMNVLSDTATLELRRNNVEVLEEQLRQTRDRFNVGEVTRTDVAQAEARLAGARAEVSAAESQLRTSIGVYRQVIGVEPRQLAPGRPLDRYVPASLDAAIAVGLKEHPQILSALHAVDASEAQVKVLEGALAPQLSVQGTVNQFYDQQLPNTQGVAASILGRLTIPIYQGGQEYAQIRQAKETVGQTRIQAEFVRDQIRAQIVSFWGNLEAAKARVIASQAQVQANEVALNGVREEARVGQRTTLDVLNAQQELLNARVNLIVAQRDRVIFSYGVVQSIGRLTARYTAVPVALYSPKTHFDQVKDLWYGVGTPDGR